MDEEPYSELVTISHSLWQTADILDAGPCSLYLQVPAEIWHSFPALNYEVISMLLVLTGLCCFVHWYIKPLHAPPVWIMPSGSPGLKLISRSLLAPALWQAASWQGYVQCSPAFWPSLGSLLDINMPLVSDWLHPSLRFSLFILYWKLIPFSRIIKLLLLLCFIYGCWLLALKMNLQEFRVPIAYPLFSLPDALGSWVGEISLLRVKHNLLEPLPGS